MASLWLLLALLPVMGGAERFSCRGRILGAYYADAKAHCKAFHVCVRVAGGGIRDFRFFCPPGTLFHQEAQTCTDWGDDDYLACPADLYDGQFDLYKIGSGFDTKKSSSNNNRDEEADFGLQRAETGDRRLSQNSISGSSDLRAAHSSDFFSGQRDRGRDDSPPPPASSSSRQSFRRTPPPRSSPTTPQYSTPQPSPSTNKPQYNNSPPKRKLVRKRPVYVSTTPAPTFPPSTAKPRQYQEPQQNFAFRPTPEQQQQRVFQQTTLPPNLPQQYREEYVEVSRVAPKPSKYYTNTVSPTPFVSSVPTSPATRNPKKEGLIELYNYESQQQQQNNQQRQQQQQFKLRNSFNVSPELKRPQERNNNNINISPNGLRGNGNRQEFSSSRNPGTSTAAYNNFNSVSYEPEKNFAQFSSAKQNYFISKNQTPSPSTTTFAPTRADVSGNLNTVAYNTNVGFNAQPINYVENDEDDGQYRPPPGEDDGQYRPEIYERELLTGAHSLNIAASGNRLPDDQKPRTKGQTSAPRPFRPAPTPTETSTYRAPEPTYTTTSRPQTVNTQRTFDYFQTYTTTSRPTDTSVTVSQSFSTPVRSSSSLAPRPPTSQPKPPSTAQPQPTPPRTQPPPPPSKKPPPKQSPPPSFVKPANTKEDNSYDYAYYDTDSGFSEYDQIEEFGKTKVKA